MESEGSYKQLDNARREVRLFVDLITDVHTHARRDAAAAAD